MMTAPARPMRSAAVPGFAQIENGGDDGEREQEHADGTLRADCRRGRGSHEEQE